MTRATAFCLVLLSWALSGAALGQAGRTADAPYAQADGSGVVQSVDYGAQTMIVSGYRYAVAVDAEVEIGGSYGAFTMLRPGMRIYFDYLVVSPSERWMVAIRELPASVVLEES